MTNPNDQLPKDAPNEPAQAGSEQRVVSPPLPCPFCGAKAEIVKATYGSRIYCNHDSACLLNARIVYDFQLREWNRRLTNSSPMRDQLTSPPAESAPAHSVQRMVRPSLLDIFCGRGGWTKAFLKRGWWCVGVDLCEQTNAETLEYPGVLMKCNAFDLTPNFIESFDAIVSSPPCEEFARAWLPWLRGDKTPERWALELLEWSVALCVGRKNRITECSNFAGRHVPGGTRFESYTLWGDVPVLMPQLPRRKMAGSGMRPDLRAEIPPHLADWIADNYTKHFLSVAQRQSGSFLSCDARTEAVATATVKVCASNTCEGSAFNSPPRVQPNEAEQT